MKTNPKRTLICIIALAILLPCFFLSVFAETVTIDQVQLTYSQSTSTSTIVDTNVLSRKYQSEANGAHTATWDSTNNRFVLSVTNSTYDEKKYGLTYYYYAQNYAVTLTLTNNTQNAVKMQYRVEDTVDSHAAGTYNQTLLVGQSVSFTLSTKETDGTTRTANTLTGYVYIDSLTAMENVDVSFASSSRGSYTYQIADGDEIPMEKGGSSTTAQTLGWGTEVTLTHGTADSGYTFYGWMANGKLLGTTDGTYTIEDDAIIYPAYLITEEYSKGAVYKVGDNEYWLWTPAVADAKNSGNTIVLNRDYTLPTTLEDAGFCSGFTASDYLAISNGEAIYKIPYGVTLLIPCDDANTVYTTTPGHDNNDSYTAPTVYRKLTMASGANITVNGAISIGGKAGTHMQTTNNTADTYYTNGAPSGPLGYIDMTSGSSITVGNGGNLYTWGFITGSGSVTVKSGGAVHEDLQIRDYRGGDGTSSLIENDSKAFPFSQYYIQNIEVPLTLEAGATEKVCMTVSVTLAGVQQSSAVYIGNDTAGGLLRLTDGSITKTYDGSTDRIIYDLDGDVSFGNLNVSIKVAMLGSTITIDSEDYVMPITHNMTLNVKDDSTVLVNQDLALLPGSIVNIAKDATVTLGSDNSLFVYDQESWKTSYVGIRSILFSAVKYAPGMAYTRTNADLVDAEVQLNGTLDATNGYVYTTGSGANIHSTGSGKLIVGAIGSAEYTYQPLQSDTDITGYDPISVTSAKLLNGDGTTYVGTADNGVGTYNYYASTARWDKPSHFYDETDPVVTAPTCTASGYTTHTCAVCGDSYQDSPTDATGNHSYGEGAYTAPENYKSNGCTTYTCSVCKGTTTEALNLLSIYATSVRAGDSLDLYFYVKTSDVVTEGEYNSAYYAVVTKEFADGRSNVVKEIACSDWTAYQDDTYRRFYFTDISAKEMTDKIYVTIYDGEGKQVYAVQMETIQNYATRYLARLTDASGQNMALRTALIDMLNYGAAAQTYFGYGIENLANAGCESYQEYASDDASISIVECTDTHFIGSSVIARNNLALTLYYDISPQDYTVNVSYVDHYGAEKTLSEFTYTQITADGKTVYGVDIPELAIADGRQLITCTLTDKDGNEVSQVTYSIEGYAALTIKQINESESKTEEDLKLAALCKDLMKFVDSAWEYFHYPDTVGGT